MAICKTIFSAVAVTLLVSAGPAWAEPTSTATPAAPAGATPVVPVEQPTSPGAEKPIENEKPVEKMILKPGKALSINMETEDIVCTNDVALASKQRDKYMDSPEAGFIYAVALSRTSHVEDALREVRRARRLAEKQGGPAYFDKMIDTYEKMLTYYPDDNQVRYHLAWAYYMKAYVLAKYSHQANQPQAPYQQWVAPKAEETKPEETAAQPDKNDVVKNIHSASDTISKASPQAIPQVQKYYGLAMAKLDDLLAREPGDTWARVYRAFLRAESTGDLPTAMAEWQKVRDENPANPAAYFFLGEGYLKQGNLKECLSNVSKAIALRAVGN